MMCVEVLQIDAETYQIIVLSVIYILVLALYIHSFQKILKSLSLKIRFFKSKGRLFKTIHLTFLKKWLLIRNFSILFSTFILFIVIITILSLFLSSIFIDTLNQSDRLLFMIVFLYLFRFQPSSNVYLSISPEGNLCITEPPLVENNVLFN
jgi:hypothetical protein